MKKILILLTTLLISSQSFAFIEIMTQYKNPGINAPMPRCKGDQYCNTFWALARGYDGLRVSLRYNYPDLIEGADKGDITQLEHLKLTQEHSKKIFKAGKAVFGKEIEPNDKYFYARGYAALLFIEQRNGWNR